MQNIEMKLVMKVVVLVLVTIQVFAAETPMEYTFYVATNGSDENPGTEVEPFASLERARNAIRTLKPIPDIRATVFIREGTYILKNTFKLTAEDSGTKRAPVIYRAYKKENVRLIGGKQVTEWKHVTDPQVLRRIEEPYRDKLLYADLKAQGITDLGEIRVRGFANEAVPAGLELFFQDRPMILARWPNKDWDRIAGVPSGPNGGKFRYVGDRPKRWFETEDIWLHGYWTYDWADSYVKVKVIDTLNREIITEEPHGVYGYTEGQRYYFLNILEELDEPGEWYLDRKTGILYFWPPGPINENEVIVSILEEPMVSLEGVSYVTIRGLTFEACRRSGLTIAGGSNNLIAGCTFRNIGTEAININGGLENGVVGCDIYDVGDSGVSLSGGDRQRLLPAGNYVENNHIYRFSRWSLTYRPAVLINGVGNRISHNLIHDAPHLAILLGGNDHIIEFNEIYRVCTETTDAGAFYMGRDLSQRGNIIRYNYFHDLMPKIKITGPSYGDVMAVYLDDQSCGTTVFGNIFYNVSMAVLIGGGRDNTVENNIFVDCPTGVHVDARGLTSASDYFTGKDPILLDRLKAVNYKEPPYSVRYPTLPTIWEDNPGMPKGNKIVRNISVGGKWLALQGVDEKVITIQDNLVGDDDPGFVDLAHQNFQLKADSPAYKIGFERVPVEKIGLYKDEYRSNVP